MQVLDIIQNIDIEKEVCIISNLLADSFKLNKKESLGGKDQKYISRASVKV